ncbi:FUSC family protein [Saccharopolyspora antimicrobica]|uniref:FUSC family protein n=1 Tax=Saccharopolyspora antimicrobica TaxID=455193 RepID=UPI001FE7B3DD|nr:FUSC family protein [Saccharopolyspora antimicrobica]
MGKSVRTAKSALAARARQLLATEAGAPDPRQRQYAVLVLVAVVAGTAVGWLFDLQTPALLAGLTAVLALVATGGQSLRSDLRRFVWFTPALVLVMTVGPLLANIPVLAGLVVALVVFGSGMLPALGEHYRIGGQTFAAATLVSTTTGIGSDQPVWMLLAASASGAAFALLLRVIIGLSDPGRATRVAVARTLLEPGPGVVESAAAAWRADGSSTWLGEVLAGAARFRAARETLLAQAQQSDRIEADRLQRIVAEADQVAAELARAVRSRACTGLPYAARRDPSEAVLARGGRQDLPEAVRGINQGLDRIRATVVRRVETPLPPQAPGARRERLIGAVRAHLSFRSSLFRHSIRCTLAVAFGMVIVLLLRDPSASSLLLALYVVLQPAARDSMTGALERTGGAVLGVTALAILITLLPGAFLLVPLVIGGMLLSMPRLRSEYQTLLGCLIVITVVDQAMRLDRPLVNVGISFAANTAVGAAIALIVGYVAYLVLPSSILPDVRGAVRSTVWSVSELLRSVRAAGQGVDLPAALQAANVLALRRTQDLLGMPALLDGTGEETDDDRATRDAAVALDALRQDVATLAFRPEAEQAVAVPALRAVDDLLGGKATAKIPDVPESSAPATELLASSLLENALHARQAIDRTFGYDNPWKSYTISFVRPERLHIR